MLISILSSWQPILIPSRALLLGHSSPTLPILASSQEPSRAARGLLQPKTAFDTLGLSPPCPEPATSLSFKVKNCGTLSWTRKRPDDGTCPRTRTGVIPTPITHPAQVACSREGIYQVLSARWHAPGVTRERGTQIGSLYQTSMELGQPRSWELMPPQGPTQCVTLGVWLLPTLWDQIP